MDFPEGFPRKLLKLLLTKRVSAGNKQRRKNYSFFLFLSLKRVEIFSDESSGLLSLNFVKCHSQ